MASPTTPLTLPLFVARWQGNTLSERSASHSHFIDLCHVLGQPTPSSDPTGAFYTFEKGVKKTGGGDGFADVWLKGHFAWEYKGPRSNLKAAYQQLLQYREDLESPPLLIVCDLNSFEVHTNFTNTPAKVHRFSLADLLTTDPLPSAGMSALDILRSAFAAPERLRPQQTTAQVTEAAAAEFAKLSESLRKAGHDPEKAARFLMRLLFCLFAEDIELLPHSLFTRLVDATKTRPSEFEKRLGQLFAAMATGGGFGYDDIKHFDGGLFADAETLPLTVADLKVLLTACQLDWASIEPAIFGTLFERSLDPSKRAQLGAHYTSRDDILLIVEPVLMAPLRREWAEAQTQTEAIVAKRDTTKGRAYTTQNAKLTEHLRKFTDRLAGVRVLDPACGSGNFLYVALKQLMDLEKQVVAFAAANGAQAFFYQVEPKQLHGIEVNPYAHELAQVVVWIGYLQWLRDNGAGIPEDPILKPLQSIRQMDAVLARDEAGKLVEPEWAEADVIVGNPPFLGGKRLRTELGDSYVGDLFRLYDGRVSREADLVAYWFERARALLADGKVKRVGLLATQGIRGGANRRVLDRVKETGDIFLAWSDRDWILDGATVHVSMIGFDDGTEKTRVLDGATVEQINSDLTGAVDLTKAKRLRENVGLSFMGDTKVGPFDITAATAVKMLAAPLNPNGRHNSDVVRPWVNGKDVTSLPRGMYIIDFPPGTLLEDAALYEAPFAYIDKHVRPMRAVAKSGDATGVPWWIHQRPRSDMRSALAPLTRFIGTSSVAKHRIFAWIAHPTLPDHAVIVTGREDDYFFGVLQSRPHELWARAKGTQLRDAESGCRYTPTTTFETFPFPWPPGREPAADPRVEAIAQGARELVAKRDAWLNPPGAAEADLKKRTLTNLYNERPTWLRLAHDKLDAAVFGAYGWPRDLGDEEILSRLLVLNLERVATQGGVAPTAESEAEVDGDDLTRR